MTEVGTPKWDAINLLRETLPLVVQQALKDLRNLAAQLRRDDQADLDALGEAEVAHAASMRKHELARIAAWLDSVRAVADTEATLAAIDRDVARHRATSQADGAGE
mgnify:CR=1 FL=1